jgi:hypothetical protein
VGARRWYRRAVRTVGSRDGVRHLRADDGIRTRDPHLGKVMLYQLSHVRARTPERRAFQNFSRSCPGSKLNYPRNAGVPGSQISRPTCSA